MSLPTILIIGRPNVGKSTFFNRLSKEKKAIVHDFPGVTRDLNFSYCTYKEKNFLLIDSGGINFDDEKPASDDSFQALIEIKVADMLKTVDLILFMTDSKDGLNPADISIAKKLRGFQNKTVLMINKTDNEKAELSNFEFTKLGIDNYFSVSSLQGTGIEKTMDFIINRLNIKNEPQSNDLDNNVKISIIGKPNVGKSSLFNAIIKEEASIVSNVAGTTRDSLDRIISHNNKNYVFIDTAGIKKKIKTTKEAIDFYSYVRTIKAIEKSDICLLVLDTSEDISILDKHIARLVVDNYKALIIVANKWDIVKKDSNTINAFTKYINQELHYIDHAALLFTSALTKQRINNIFELIDSVYEAYSARISTAELNKFSQNLKSLPGYLAVTSKFAKIYYLSQVETKPPTFTLFINKKTNFKTNFKKFFENQIRNKYNFNGVTLKTVLKEKPIKDQLNN